MRAVAIIAALVVIGALLPFAGFRLLGLVVPPLLGVLLVLDTFGLRSELAQRIPALRRLRPRNLGLLVGIGGLVLFGLLALVAARGGAGFRLAAFRPPSAGGSTATPTPDLPPLSFTPAPRPTLGTAPLPPTDPAAPPTPGPPPPVLSVRAPTPGGAAAPLGSPAPIGSPTPTPAARLVVANTGGDGVALRAEPPSGRRVKVWPDGTEVTPLGEEQQAGGQSWKRVRDPDNNVGWIAAAYLVPAARGATVAPGPQPTLRSGTIPRPPVPPYGAACPYTHLIKADQARVYHLPGSVSYGQTKPEVCFASEADAQAAGYKRGQP